MITSTILLLSGWGTCIKRNRFPAWKESNPDLQNEQDHSLFDLDSSSDDPVMSKFEYLSSGIMYVGFQVVTWY